MAWLIIAAAVCILGADGNVYSNQTAEETFMNVDLTKGPLDLRLKPGSCAVDMGATISGVTHDFDGVKRPQGKAYDIGAFELIPSRPMKPEGLRIN